MITTRGPAGARVSGRNTFVQVIPSPHRIYNLCNSCSPTACARKDKRQAQIRANISAALVFRIPPSRPTSDSCFNPPPRMDYTLRLPAETLCHIFHCARLANGVPTHSAGYVTRLTPTPQKSTHRMRMLAWILLTHVCSRWRTLALSDASLWTEAPSSIGQRWLREFFKRSGNRAVWLDWGNKFPTFTMSPAFAFTPETVYAYHKRLRNFCVLLGPDSSLLNTLSISWPKLETLEVTMWDLFAMSPLFAEHAPRLRHLGIRTNTSSYAWPWRSLNTLVVLDLDFLYDKHARSMVACLNALDCMPGLRHLRLGGCEPDKEDDEEDNDLSQESHISPHCTCRGANSARSRPALLETLVMKCEWRMVLHISQHICPPPRARVSIISRDLAVHAHYTNGSDHQKVDRVCEDIRDWQRAQDRPRTLDNEADIHSAPYIALAVVLDWDAPRGISIVRHLMSRSPRFPDKLSSEDWREGRDGVHFDLEISHQLPYSNKDAIQFVAALTTQSLKALETKSIVMLSLGAHKTGPIHKCSDHVFALNHLADAILQNLEILLLPEFSAHYVFSIVGLCNPEDGDIGRASGKEAHWPLPKLKAIDFDDCLLEDVLAPESISALKELFGARPHLRVYLRVAEQINRSTATVLDTLPSAKIIGSRTNVAYADSLGLSLIENSDVDGIEIEDGKRVGDVSV